MLLIPYLNGMPAYGASHLYFLLRSLSKFDFRTLVQIKFYLFEEII
jgi:hypothetical protein